MGGQPTGPAVAEDGRVRGMTGATPDQEAIHDDIAFVGEEISRIVEMLVVHPPEIAAVVAGRALRPLRIGKLGRRLTGFIAAEVSRKRDRMARREAAAFAASDVVGRQADAA